MEERLTGPADSESFHQLILSLWINVSGPLIHCCDRMGRTGLSRSQWFKKLQLCVHGVGKGKVRRRIKGAGVGLVDLTKHEGPLGRSEVRSVNETSRTALHVTFDPGMGVNDRAAFETASVVILCTTLFGVGIGIVAVSGIGPSVFVNRAVLVRASDMLCTQAFISS